MNKEFIPYEQALELKELGFNELCLFYYTDNEALRIYHQSEIYDDLVGAPLYQQAFRWFREKYGIMYIVYNNTENWKNTFHGAYSKINSDYESDYTDDYNTYEEAELACLKKLIEIVKNK
jgi:hypothetical protein